MSLPQYIAIIIEIVKLACADHGVELRMSDAQRAAHQRYSNLNDTGPTRDLYEMSSYNLTHKFVGAIEANNVNVSNVQIEQPNFTTAFYSQQDLAGYANGAISQTMYTQTGPSLPSAGMS